MNIENKVNHNLEITTKFFKNVGYTQKNQVFIDAECFFWYSITVVIVNSTATTAQNKFSSMMSYYHLGWRV